MEPVAPGRLDARRRVIVLGYVLPALVSALALAEVRTAGDVVSVAAFAAGQGLALASLRWAATAALGFLVGWAAGPGVAAAAGLLAAVALGFITREPLTEPGLRFVVLPAAGLAGGAVAGGIVGLVELLGGLHVRVLPWIGANAAGGALTGIGLALAFTIPDLPARVGLVAYTAAAGAAWGALAIGAARAES